MKLLVSVATLLLALGGCATTPVPAASAQPVPASRLLGGYSAFATPSAELVHLTIVRDSGMLGAGASAKLSIDGTDIAKLRNRERLDLYLKPGSYIFGVEPSPRLAGALVENSFDLAMGKQYFFRLSVSTSGSFVLQPSARLE